MPDVHDPPTEGRAYTWLVRGLYVGLISAELWFLFDWWRDTPSGQEAVARWRQRFEEAQRKAQNCEGCARRKAALQAAINRMHWQAEEIVEEAAEHQEPPT